MDNSNRLQGHDQSETHIAANIRKREEALREYYFIEDLIDKFNERSLTIKSWSITSCGVALGLGASEKQPLLFCLAAFGSIVFWYLEASWKSSQITVADRLQELERLLSQETLAYDGPKINATFGKAFQDEVDARRILHIMMRRNIRVPHLFITLLGILAFLISALHSNLAHTVRGTLTG
jgi:hypothetical protein